MSMVMRHRRGLTALEREMSSPPALLCSMAHFTFYVGGRLVVARSNLSCSRRITAATPTVPG